MGTRRLLLALVAPLCWRVSLLVRCGGVDEAVLDRVLGWWSLLALPFASSVIFEWLAAWFGYCSPLGMTCEWAGSPLEERVYRGAGRSRRRARGDGVLVWSGVALPCLCVVACFWVSSFERERERRRHFSSVGRSLRLCVRNVVFV